MSHPVKHMWSSTIATPLTHLPYLFTHSPTPALTFLTYPCKTISLMQGGQRSLLHPPCPPGHLCPCSHLTPHTIHHTPRAIYAHTRTSPLAPSTNQRVKRLTFALGSCARCTLARTPMHPWASTLLRMCRWDTHVHTYTAPAPPSKLQVCCCSHSCTRTQCIWLQMRVQMQIRTQLGFPHSAWADPCVDPGLDLERGGKCMEDDVDDERSAGLSGECEMTVPGVALVWVV